MCYIKTNLKEEDRLAAVISRIEEEALIIPRAGFIQQPTGEIVKNRLFEGLSVIEAAKFNNYLHFRPARLLEEKSPLFRANLDKAIDFLDPIDEDQPNGKASSLLISVLLGIVRNRQIKRNKLTIITHD